MTNAISDISGDQPDATLNDPQQALWWLLKGDLQVNAAWERAHEISQSAEGSADYDRVHALAHLIEGDQWNAEYWYRRCGKKQHSTDLKTEWDHIASALT